MDPDTARSSAPAAIRLGDGTFANPWPDSAPRGWSDLLRWRRDRRGTVIAPSPPRNSLSRATPRIAQPRSRNGEFAATWIGHATVLLQLDGLNVLTDPMFSQRAFPVQWMGPRRIMDPNPALEALPPIDVVAISHSHYDHLDRDSVRRLARRHPDATWAVPLGLAAYLRPWGVRNVVEFDWWQDEVVVPGLRVTATPARHFSARRIGDRNRTLWCGFSFAAGERRAWFAGDTAYHPDFGTVGARCGPFDLVMIPIGAYDPRWFMHVVHVDPEEAVRVYRDVVVAHPAAPPPTCLAIHWGTFRLTDEPIDEPPARTRACWSAAGLPESRLWIADFGETRMISP